MRLHEFVSQSTPESNLVTALELLQNRYKNSDKPPRISTQSLINLVLNTDKNFDYQALVAANENNEAVRNLIKTFNKEYVELASDSGNNEAPTTNVGSNSKTGQPDTVDSMAKRAAKQRGAAISQ